MNFFIFELLLIGCSESEDTVADSIVLPEEKPMEPIWSPTEVGENLDTLLSYGVPNPYPILERYLELYDEGGTPNCPGTNYNFDGSEANNSGCYTEDNYFYAGLGELRQDDEGFDLHCDCRIMTPDGRMIRGAGNISILDQDSHLMIDIRGSFLEIKNEYTGTWLEELPSISLSVASSNGEIVATGGYTINGMSLYLENFQIGSCAMKQDTIYFRDPSGGWWSWVINGTCTEGELFFQGTPYGTMTWNSEQIDISILEVLERQ